MRLNERSYSGRFFRPKPISSVNDNQKSILLAVPWGEKNVAENLLQQAQDSIASFTASRDPEMTVAISDPFANLETTQQKLSAMLKSVNSKILKQYNATEYSSAVEFLAVVIEGKTINWVQAGAVHLFVQNQKGIQPLCYSPDWAWQIHNDVPLLCEGIGLKENLTIHTGSYHLYPHDRLLCVARSYVPPQLFSAQSTDLDNLSRILVEESEQAPFWLATVEL